MTQSDIQLVTAEEPFPFTLEQVMKMTVNELWTELDIKPAFPELSDRAIKMALATAGKLVDWLTEQDPVNTGIPITYDSWFMLQGAFGYNVALSKLATYVQFCFELMLGPIGTIVVTRPPKGTFVEFSIR